MLELNTVFLKRHRKPAMTELNRDDMLLLKEPKQNCLKIPKQESGSSIFYQSQVLNAFQPQRTNSCSI